MTVIAIHSTRAALCRLIGRTAAGEEPPLARGRGLLVHLVPVRPPRGGRRRLPLPPDAAQAWLHAARRRLDDRALP